MYNQTQADASINAMSKKQKIGQGQYTCAHQKNPDGFVFRSNASALPTIE